MPVNIKEAGAVERQPVIHCGLFSLQGYSVNNEAGQVGWMPDFEGLVSTMLEGLDFVLKISSSYQKIFLKQWQNQCIV